VIILRAADELRQLVHEARSIDVALSLIELQLMRVKASALPSAGLTDTPEWRRASLRSIEAARLAQPMSRELRNDAEERSKQKIPLTFEATDALIRDDILRKIAKAPQSQ